MPTVVMATSGADRCSSTSTSAMPQAAPAALASMRRMNGLRPIMSVTENIIVMSLTPTHGPTFPDAIVETMILGNPYGSSRMTAVARVVPCVPPSATRAWTFRAATRSFMTTVAPAAIAGADSSRLALARSTERDEPPASATSEFE
jgi:hypothetical protein